MDPAPSRCPRGPPRHHPGALSGSPWVGLGALPAHCWTRHHPGALRVRPGTIPVHLESLACTPPGADLIFVLAPSLRTGGPARRSRVQPDILTSHTPEREVGGGVWGMGPTCNLSRTLPTLSISLNLTLPAALIGSLLLAYCHIGSIFL